MVSISLDRVTKIYTNNEEPVSALEDVSFDIEQGKLAVVLGPSGSGKSTLLNLLGGMDRVTRGHIYINGNDITQWDNPRLVGYRRNDVGFVFQFYNLVPTLNAYDNIRKEADSSLNPYEPEDILIAVGLEKRKGHFPAELSGGELQRLTIARAIVRNPKILLCDEPTGTLEPASELLILDLLHEMAHQYGKTVLIATLNQSISEIADCIIHLHDGKVVDNGMSATAIVTPSPSSSPSHAPSPSSSPSHAPSPSHEPSPSHAPSSTSFPESPPMPLTSIFTKPVIVNHNLSPTASKTPPPFQPPDHERPEAPEPHTFSQMPNFITSFPPRTGPQRTPSNSDATPTPMTSQFRDMPLETFEAQPAPLAAPNYPPSALPEQEAYRQTQTADPSPAPLGGIMKRFSSWFFDAPE
ncbi:MAG: ATP-binding cassette domain-containing protein [Peptococcaceae bacterium]|nr:ATP-binding cassette domain-containing protein [Peptococcaceae bacterium]